MSKTLNMTDGKPIKLLFSFALPLMFGNIFQQLYTVVDTAIVGRGVGMDALAALGCVDWLNWMLIGIIQGFTQGFSVRMSQRFGQRDIEGLKKTIGQAAILCILIAVLCTALSQLCLPLFLLMLRVPPELSYMAQLYTRIIMAGLPAVMFFNFCSSVLRSVGDSKTPLYAMIAASITNIVLDLVAVFVLDWGIAGAAAATVAAQCLSGGICAVRIFKTQELHFRKEHCKIHSPTCRDLFRIGWPMAGKNVVISAGGMVIQSIVNGFSLSFIAGFTATNKLYGLLEIAALSYGYAITTYVGQNYGAGRYDRIRSGLKSALSLSLVTSVIIGALMLIFGRPITMLFISAEDPAMMLQAGNIAYWYLCCMAVSLPMLYILFVYLSALQGIGNTVAAMLSGVLELFLRVSLALLVGWTGFEYGIFGAEVSAWYGAAIYLCISYYRSAKKLFPKKGLSQNA